MMNAINTSHETHLLKIENREAELLARVNSWKSALMKSVGESQSLLNFKLRQRTYYNVLYYRSQEGQRSAQQLL